MSAALSFQPVPVMERSRDSSGGNGWVLSVASNGIYANRVFQCSSHAINKKQISQIRIQSVALITLNGPCAYREDMRGYVYVLVQFCKHTISGRG